VTCLTDRYTPAMNIFFTECHRCASSAPDSILPAEKYRLGPSIKSKLQAFPETAVDYRQLRPTRLTLGFLANKRHCRGRDARIKGKENKFISFTGPKHSILDCSGRLTTSFFSLLSVEYPEPAPEVAKMTRRRYFLGENNRKFFRCLLSGVASF
jgi:hypothetical protein